MAKQSQQVRKTKADNPSSSASVTTRQSIRRASSRLEYHMFAHSETRMSRFLDEQVMKNKISYSIYTKGRDLLLKVAKEKKEKQKKIEKQSIPKAQQSEQQGVSEDDDKGSKSHRLLSQFEYLLEESGPSYEKTSLIFRSRSLREKYQHLLNGQSSDSPPPQRQYEPLTDFERSSLEKVKKIYKKYKVSSLFRKTLLQKIRKGIIDVLMGKGYLVEYRAGIISLIC